MKSAFCLVLVLFWFLFVQYWGLNPVVLSTGLHAQHFFLILREHFPKLPRLTSNLWFFCLSLLNTWDYTTVPGFYLVIQSNIVTFFPFLANLLLPLCLPPPTPIPISFSLLLSSLKQHYPGKKCVLVATVVSNWLPKDLEISVPLRMFLMPSQEKLW